MSFLLSPTKSPSKILSPVSSTSTLSPATSVSNLNVTPRKVDFAVDTPNVDLEKSTSSALKAKENELPISKEKDRSPNCSSPRKNQIKNSLTRSHGMELKDNFNELKSHVLICERGERRRRRRERERGER
jgi:hypothetical protein